MTPKLHILDQMPPKLQIQENFLTISGPKYEDNIIGLVGKLVF